MCECVNVSMCMCVLHAYTVHSLWPLIMVIWRYIVQFLIAKGATVNIRRKV